MRLLFLILVFISNIHLYSQTEINECTRGGPYYLSDSTLVFNKKVNGKKDGWWKSWYFICRVKKVAYYKNGKKNGKSIEFYRNGDIKSEGTYLNGKKNGVFILFNKRTYGFIKKRVRSDAGYTRYNFVDGYNKGKLPPTGHQAF